MHTEEHNIHFPTCDNEPALSMLVLPVLEIGQNFGTFLGFTKLLPIDLYFSFDILIFDIILILNKYLTKYFRILITPSLLYLALKMLILRMKSLRGVLFLPLF